MDSTKFGLHFIFEHSSCKIIVLKRSVQIQNKLSLQKTFHRLDKDILFDLLKRDDLQGEEIDAWDCLIKWGIEQTPGLGSKNSDRAKWNQENFEALKETLNLFIPLIRFSEISRANFFDKVRPYKAVFPHHIYEDVVEFYYKETLPKTTLPPRVGKIQIESKLIKPKTRQYNC